MKYLCIDVGGSGIKYAVMDDNFNMISNGIHKLSVQKYNDFIVEIKKIYEQNGRPDGGIAISYCGELDEKIGLIYNGGSYSFNTGNNLKQSLEEACKTKVSIENDGNCAALAELHEGVLQEYKDSVVVVIGTGLGGAIILNKKIRHGINKFAGSLSFMTSDIGMDFGLNNMIAKNTSFHYIINEYNRKSMNNIQTGYDFFELVNNKEELAIQILTKYCRNIANVLFNIHLILDVECIAVGGGISVQPIFQEIFFKEFRKIFNTTPINKLNIRMPCVNICQYNNNSNLYGALCHHLNL